MPWGRLDDTLYDHEKVEAIEPGMRRLAALGLWTLANSWCNRKLTDGAIPASRPSRLADDVDPAEVADLTDALVDAELWERRPDGFQVHDFLEYNDSREEVLERRRLDAERARARRRAAQGPSGPTSGTTSDATHARRPAGVPQDVRENVGTNVPPESGEESQHARARPRAADTRPGPARPVPSRPETSIDQVPGAVHRASDGGNHLSKTDDEGERPTVVTLTKAQLTAWRSFTDPIWQPFMAAWMERGFRLPPRGEATDEPGEGEPSARAILWQIADARPNDLGRWVRGAPAGARPNEIISHVIGQWHALRSSVDSTEEPTSLGPSKSEAAEALGSIMARVTRVNGQATEDDDLAAFGQ